MDKHKRINQAYKLFFVSLTVLPLLAANAWSFSGELTYSGVTQLGGVDTLENYLAKKGEKDKYSEILKTLREIAMGATETGIAPDYWWVRLTVQPDLKLVFPDGTVVVDEVCAGDTILLKKGADKGEFWQDGGNCDSPPVYWVADSDDTTIEILENIVSLYKAGKYKPALIQSGSGSVECERVNQDTYVDDVSNLLVYRGATHRRNITLTDPASMWGITPVDGVVVCSLNKKSETVQGLTPAPGDVYIVVGKNGTAYFKADYELKSMYYVSRFDLVPQENPYINCLLAQAPSIPECGLGIIGIILTPDAKCIDGFIIDNIVFEKSLRVVSPASGKVEISVPGSDDLVFGEANNLRVLVKNVGDTDVSIKKVSATGDYKFVSCDSEVVKPGEEAECLISVTPQMGQGLKVFVDYEYKSCGKTKTGTASKVLIESTAVTPAASAQVYSIDVHGDCENQYYGCYAPDNDGKFAAGYKCYNTGDQYYSPVRERFDLRFDLPDLTSKTVVGARLNMFASNINKPQDVALYSGGNDWTPATCSASGDICTQPYCSECIPSFEFKAGIQQSTQKIQGNAITFDISDLVKKAYVEGAKSLSLQLRGEEDAWNSGGKDSCAGMNAWTQQDIEIYGKGPNQPYLEIVYK